MMVSPVFPLRDYRTWWWLFHCGIAVPGDS
jgi:hypothetical protein